MKPKHLAALTLAASAAPLVVAGPASYGLCVAACNAFVVSCYSAAGFTFGATFFGAPPAIMACNAAYASCMVACVGLGAGPIP